MPRKSRELIADLQIKESRGDRREIVVRSPLTRNDSQRFRKLTAAAVLVVSFAGCWWSMTNCAAVEAPEQSTALPADNLFAVPSPLAFHAPAFDKIRIEHFLPTFTFGMKQQLAEMNAIAGQTAAPTFENTIVAMERSGALLTRVENVFSNLTSAEKNKALQNIETELAPLRAAHSDNILLNRPLFQRVETVWQKKESLGLTEEQAEVLKQRYESFLRAGARLSDQDQGRIRSLNEQLSKLETKFEENLLAIAKERARSEEHTSELQSRPHLV